MRAIVVAGLAFAAVALLGAGLTGPGRLDRCVGTRMIETTLYFGMSSPDGMMYEEDWLAFRDSHIVPRFKEGFTLLRGEGHWQDPDTGFHAGEASRVLVRVHDGSDDGAFDDLIEVYKTRFKQKSVLRTDAQICAQF
ncbi:MAG: DUF3574 domain-containing protein [Alphaproteobacteria bacterium]